MKQLFKTAFLAFASVAVIACEPKIEEQPQDKPVLTITSSERIVAVPDGGQYNVTFAIENPVEGVTVLASCEDEWISDYDYSSEGTIVFTVSANDTGESRETIISLVYDYSDTEEPVTASVIVSQDANVLADVKHDCKFVDGQFYGDIHTVSGEQMYYMNFSTLGFKEDGTVYPDGVYYQLTFFTDEIPADFNNIDIPDGTYEIGEFGKTDAGTISRDYSRYFIANSDGTNFGEGPFGIKDGSIHISTDNGQKFIEGIITTDDDRTHYIYYRGETNIILFNNGFDHVNFDNNVDKVYIGGANYMSGTDESMLISMTITQDHGNNGEGMVYPSTVMYLDINCPADKYGILPGKYNISDSGDTYTIPSGKIELVGGYETFVGAHMIIFEENGIHKAALITGGDITFEKDGNIYTMTGNLETILGYKFTFSYTGEIAIPNIPGDGFSTLTEDITVDLTDATGFVAYWGDEYGTGNGRYDISINSAEWGGESVYFDIAAEGLDCSAGIPSGTYTAAAGDVPGAGEYVKGYQDELGVLWGTRYEGGYDEIGFINVCAPALSGELTIVNKGNEMYDISFVFMDEKGYKWSGEWSGEISLVDFTDF